jgi:hypothetical protein
MVIVLFVYYPPTITIDTPDTTVICLPDLLPAPPISFSVSAVVAAVATVAAVTALRVTTLA